MTESMGEDLSRRLDTIIDRVADLMDDARAPSMLDAHRIAMTYLEVLSLFDNEERARICSTSNFGYLTRKISEINEFSRLGTVPEVRDPNEGAWGPVRELLRSLILHLRFGIELD